MPNIPKLIAVDLDGTVFGEDHRTIPPRTKAVLQAYVDRGTLLVPVTGRAKAIIPVDSFPPLQYLISANGGYICHMPDGVPLRSVCLDNRDIRQLWEQIRDRADRVNMVMELFVQDRMVVERKVYENFETYADKLPQFHRLHIAGGEAEYTPSFDSYLLREPGQVVKVNFPGKSIRDCPEIREEMMAMGLFEVTSDGLNLELTRKGCHKGEALLWLCGHLGIAPEDVVVFGNGNNDVSMLSCVPCGVAMGNSADDVKAAASYCTASNTEDGIALFLERMFPLEEM